VLNILLQKKDAVLLTEVGAVIPEQKLLNSDVKRGICRVKEIIKMLFKDLQTNSATSKAHQKGVTCIKSSYLNH